MIYENYMNLIKKLPTIERDQLEKSKRKDIDDLLTNQQRAHSQFSDNFMAWDTDKAIGTEQEAIDERDRDQQLNPHNFEDVYYGRMSPFSKEVLYRDYLKGMTTKDLSLKFGILQQRVKAIVY